MFFVISMACSQFKNQSQYIMGYKCVGIKVCDDEIHNTVIWDTSNHGSGLLIRIDSLVRWAGNSSNHIIA